MDDNKLVLNVPFGTITITWTAPPGWPVDMVWEALKQATQTRLNDYVRYDSKPEVRNGR